MKPQFWTVLLSTFSMNTFAQDQHSQLNVGLGAMLSDSVYAGEGTRVIPIPLINYQGDRFFLQGITAGWKLKDSSPLEISAIAKFRFDGFSVEDLGEDELAQNGIDYNNLEDRDFALDAGIGMKWSGSLGEMEIELLQDVSNNSDGQEAMVQYGYPIPMWGGMVKFNAGFNWLSKDLANYYYGTLDEEVARGVVEYRPNAVTNINFGISYFRPLTESWSLMTILNHSRLADEIQNSPLTDKNTDNTTSILLGISKQF
ncbi:MltA-interacting protein [Thalassocella blandensis]|nr:MltA-interacting protein [Thalassocella blandensis]